MQNSQSIAFEHMQTGKLVTASILNKIWAIYNIHTT